MSGEVTDCVLAARALRRAFGSFLAVDHVDLSLRRGETLGLLGPNGAGKTTTLRMLLGHVRPDAGECSLFGAPVRPGCAELARVGALVEGPAFYPWLTGRRNLEIMLACRGFSRRERRERAAAAGERLGLAEALDRRYAGYSSGMARKLGIASAIAHDPELLILDEPTAGLDPVATAELRDLLRSLAAERHTAILLSSHLLGDVEVLADSIVLVRAGRVVRAGSTESLLTGSGERYILELEYMDAGSLERARGVSAAVEGVTLVAGSAPLEVEASRAARARLVAALAAAGLAPVGVERRRMTLEQFFLEEAT